VLPKEKLAEAFRYTLNPWNALNQFTAVSHSLALGPPACPATPTGHAIRRTISCAQKSALGRFPLPQVFKLAMD
jgi:hypothetical protein